MDIKTASEKLKLAYARVNEQRKKRSIIIIDCPSFNPVNTHTCQAINLNGKKCIYRVSSSCGRFCKRHALTESCDTIDLV